MKHITNFIQNNEDKEKPWLFTLNEGRQMISGNPGDSVGPGHYNNQKLPKGNIGTNWHISKTIREVQPFKIKENNAEVGPGKYNSDIKAIMLDISSRNKKSISNKRSMRKVDSLPRIERNEFLEFLDTPKPKKRKKQEFNLGKLGPGYYDHSYLTMKAESKPEMHQNFGSSSERFPAKRVEINKSMISQKAHIRSLNAKIDENIKKYKNKDK